jgi:hypothetical protein
MRSLTYWHPVVYEMLMRVLFRENYNNRYVAISGLIEENVSVVDVCCGDCMIYNFLKNKGVDYLGLDFNDTFVRWAGRRNIDARLFDILKDELPSADYVLMQAGLYQFAPDYEEVLGRLYRAARKYLIVSEPVVNYAGSDSRIMSILALLLNNPGDGIKKYRFNQEELRSALSPYKAEIVREFLSPGGREYICMIKKDGAPVRQAAKEFA